MSCCPSGNPGTPTFSSGLTAQRAAAAIRSDQAQLLARLRVGSADCCPPPRPNPKSAVYSSVLTQDQATRCQPPAAVQALTYPKVGVPESIRIQRLTTETIECAYDPYNPDTRFNGYTRFVPQAPCPAPTAAQLNSTNAKPTFWPGCTPQRFIK